MSRCSPEELQPRPPAPPKRRFVKLGKRTSDGYQQSGTSSEGAFVRKSSKSRVRNHSNRLSGVFLRGPLSGSMASSLRSSLHIQTRKASTISTCALITEDPSELSNHVTAPGVLKIFGNEICEGAHYKSVLATTHSSAKELVKEALERYGLNKDQASSYVLCDTIGSIGDHRWRTEGFRVVGDNEKPLLLQSLWKPREGLARRFEIQRKSSVEEQASRERDTVTAGINAQARKLQKSRSRVTTSLLSAGRSKLWRSKSSTDMLNWDKSPTHQSHSSLHSFEIPKTFPEQSHIQEDFSRGGDPGEGTNGLCEPGAGGYGEEWEREETESSDENLTQFYIHPPQQCPYLLLLQGRSRAQDFIIYLLTNQSTTVGRVMDSEPDSKLDISLFADDILPKHCQFLRCENGGPTTLCPCPDAVVTRNGDMIKTEVQLNPGDVIGLGLQYLFMFKDTSPLSQQDSSDSMPWLLAHTSPSVNELILCHSCVSTCADRRPPFFKTPQGLDLTITFPPEIVDSIIKEIVGLNRSTHSPPLTVAFLISLCIQYSSTSLQASDLRRLLLLVASHVQSTMWELTKDLAAVQPEVLDTEEIQPLSLDAVISGLRSLVVWMSNCLELLHFIQFELPVFLDWRSGQEQGQVEGSDRNLVLQIYLSCLRSAMDQTIAVLEEVVMLAFQQCVYYITKVLFPMLPAVLDCNPFRGTSDPPDPTDDSSILGCPGLQTPPELKQVLEVLNQTWRLLQDGQLHQDISAQLIAYLFYFINASLFNSLMERGSEAGFYQWSRGVHLRGSLDLLLDWAHEAGLGELVSTQTLTLSSAINLLATPRKTLVKTSWSSLRSLYPALRPSQLNHLLSLYTPLSQNHHHIWSPCVQERDAAHHTSDILESFDTQHPLVLPDGGYQFQSGREVPEPRLWDQMERLAEFISKLCESSEEQKVSLKADSRSSSQKSSPPPSPTSALYYDFNSCTAQLLSQRLQNLELQNQEDNNMDKPALDPSCLLTLPNTPHITHHQVTTEQEQWKNNGINQWSNEGSNKKGGLVFECLAALKADRCNMKTLVELKEEEEEEEDYDNDEVFSLELERGERGIGLALIDTREDTLLKVKGIFIRAVVPDSPAARCERLAPGDRILAVNGVSLIGLDYQGGKELIQSSGERVRLLVARSDWKTQALET